MNSISQELREAYKNTVFRVRSGDDQIDLKIESFSEPLLALHKSLNVNCSAFITAYNPFSQQLELADNERLQQLLAEEIRESGYKILDGIGIDPSGEWEGEPSFLIPGCSREQAEVLGNKYQQNAVVWCGESAIPELVELV